MVSAGHRRVVAWEAASRGGAYVEARTRRGRCALWLGSVSSPLMGASRARTLDVVLAADVEAHLALGRDLPLDEALPVAEVATVHRRPGGSENRRRLPAVVANVMVVTTDRRTGDTVAMAGM